MVIIHMSDKQRRIISPERNETLEAVFKRFCIEFGYQEKEYQFQSFPPDPLVSLDMNMSAIRVKEVALVPKRDVRRESSDSCYTTIHDVSPEVPPKLKDVVPPARPPPIGLKSKPAKRSAPKPPSDLSLNAIRRESSSSPDIEIPLPPPFHPSDSQPSKQIFVSTECETEMIRHQEVVVPDSTPPRSSSNSLRYTPDSHDHETYPSNSVNSIDDSDDDDTHYSEPEPVKNLTNEEHWRESRVNQSFLHDMSSDYERIESVTTSNECANSINLDMENTSGVDPVPLLDDSLRSLCPAPVIEEINVIQFQLPVRHSLSEQGLEMGDETVENYLGNGSKERRSVSNIYKIDGDIKREKTVAITTNLIGKRLSLTGADPVSHSQSGNNSNVNFDTKPTRSLKTKVEMSHACTSIDLLESGDEDYDKIHVTTEQNNKSVARGNQKVVSTPVPSARLSSSHYWDVSKQSKTIQFVPQTMNTNDHSGNAKPAAGDDKARESLLVASAASAPLVTKPVKVIVQEEPVKESDRPTYRPRQAKSLYFTAETK